MAERRDRVSDRRDSDADLRDVAAELRDAAAERRDVAAAARDGLAALRDETGGVRPDPPFPGQDLLLDPLLPVAGSDDQLDWAALLARTVEARLATARLEAEIDRQQALRDREEGAQQRTRASRDRADASRARGWAADGRRESNHDRDDSRDDRSASAQTRAESEMDRDSSETDRSASAADRRVASLDGLTGAYLRGSGFRELQREISRARRNGSPLTVGFFDVDGLKHVNDLLGHAAGDDILIKITRALQAHLRSYDLLIRYGGDEFVCVLAGLDEATAGDRLSMLNSALTIETTGCTASMGIAYLRSDDTADDIVIRADTVMYEARRARRQG